MRGLACAWIVIAGLSGCTQSPEDEARSVCSTLCDCLASPLPAAHTQCTTQCVGQFSTNPLPELCTQCVFEHANRCAALESDCNPLCQRTQPPGDMP